MRVLIKLSVFLGIVCCLVAGELFTALVELERLLTTEKEVNAAIDKYLQLEESRLQKIRRYQAEYKRLNEIAAQNSDEFVSNPVNAYLLIKRLTADWNTAEKLMRNVDGSDIIDNITRSRHGNLLRFPDDEDLSGSVAALLRLQDTYQLDTTTLASGLIKGAKPSPELTAGDCFELGRQAYSNSDHYHTVLWMQEAWNRALQDEDWAHLKGDILEYLAFSTFKQGNVQYALKLTNDLLKIDPSHSRAIGNKVYFENFLQENIAGSKKRRRGDIGEDAETQDEFLLPTESTAFVRPDAPAPDSERDIYERLCRGERLPPVVPQKPLKCYYVNKGNPSLILQPVKMEVFYERPWIVMYYDVMSNDEIEVVKELAQPKLKRATVQNYKSGELETANYRISKSAWLRNDEHPVVARLSRRIEAVTGLTTETAEELQVVNYGIGGHYEPHFDFARREEKHAFKSLGTGNRIATWINYMSDVQAGGATVFPELRLTVWPVKGSAAFWFNLHRSGDGDMLTRHAACPVLAGSKWVSNKWFHERGQEFRRPCGLIVND